VPAFIFYILVSWMDQYCFARWRMSASVVCHRRLSSVTLPAGRAFGRPTLHGGPVVLRPVRATPCLIGDSQLMGIDCGDYCLWKECSLCIFI